MTDMELAEEIERRRGGTDMLNSVLMRHQWDQIIAALRRGPEPYKAVRGGGRLTYDKATRTIRDSDGAVRLELGEGDADMFCERPPSGGMVMVRRKVLADIEEGYRSRCEYCRGVKAACEELDVKYGIPCFAREAWCALSAAEPEGRKG